MRTRRAAALALLLSSLALTGCVSETHGPVQGQELGSNLLMEEEVDRRVREIPYMRGIELVTNLERLAELGEAAVPRLRRAADDPEWLTRSSVAWIFGRTGDRRNIPTLRGMVDDSVAGVRYQAAASLVQLGDPAGFPVLVEGLGDGDIHHRFKCIEVLREATAQDFGYEHDSAPSLRRQAISRWIDWLEETRASAL